MDGGRGELFLHWPHASSQACMSGTHSPAAINLELRPLKPASNNTTALQTEEEIRSTSERMRGRKGKQAVRTDIKCTSEGRQAEVLSERGPATSAYRQEVNARRRERLQERDELMHEGGRGDRLFLLLI